MVRFAILGALALAFVLTANRVQAEQDFEIENPTIAAGVEIDDDYTINDPLVVSGSYTSATSSPDVKFWRKPNYPNGGYALESANSSEELTLMPGEDDMGTWTAELWNSAQDPWTRSEQIMPPAPTLETDHALSVQDTNNEYDWEIGFALKD